MQIRVRYNEDELRNELQLQMDFNSHLLRIPNAQTETRFFCCFVRATIYFFLRFVCKSAHHIECNVAPMSKLLKTKLIIGFHLFVVCALFANLHLNCTGGHGNHGERHYSLSAHTFFFLQRYLFWIKCDIIKLIRPLSALTQKNALWINMNQKLWFARTSSP